MSAPVFPPAFNGMDASDSDPFALACERAAQGCDAGLVTYDLAPDRLRAAIVFAPEVPLSQAVAMLPLCGVSFQNALGALAPPEVAVHLGALGEIYVNGGRCGLLRAAAAHRTPAAEPDWLVVGLTLRLWPPTEDTGLTPEETALYAEGCAEVNAVTLLEAWVRHTLLGINEWASCGPSKLHREWMALAKDLGKMISAGTRSGELLGINEHMGLLLKTDRETFLIPLTDLLTECS